MIPYNNTRHIPAGNTLARNANANAAQTMKQHCLL
jgi:hypothetical protein